jgi:hypothetical protein
MQMGFLFWWMFFPVVVFFHATHPRQIPEAQRFFLHVLHGSPRIVVSS